MFIQKHLLPNSDWDIINCELKKINHIYEFAVFIAETVCVL